MNRQKQRERERERESYKWKHWRKGIKAVGEHGHVRRGGERDSVVERDVSDQLIRRRIKVQS